MKVSFDQHLKLVFFRILRQICPNVYDKRHNLMGILFSYDNTSANVVLTNT